MLKNNRSRSKFTLQMKFVAFFAVTILSAQMLSPLTLNFVPVAQAQCGPGGCGGGSGALGNVFGGGQASMLQMVGLIMGMLMQLLQGGIGGNTPQTGTVDEQPGRFASGSERFSSGQQGGNNNSSNSVATPTPIPTANPNTYVSGRGVVLFNNNPLPTTANLLKNGTLTVSNANDASYNVEIRRIDGTTAVTQQTINSGDTKVFRFSNSGNYTLCTGAIGTTLQCSTRVNISN